MLELPSLLHNSVVVMALMKIDIAIDRLTSMPLTAVELHAACRYRQQQQKQTACGPLCETEDAADDCLYSDVCICLIIIIFIK